MNEDKGITQNIDNCLSLKRNNDLLKNKKNLNEQFPFKLRDLSTFIFNLIVTYVFRLCYRFLHPYHLFSLLSQSNCYMNIFLSKLSYASNFLLLVSLIYRLFNANHCTNLLDIVCIMFYITQNQPKGIILYTMYIYDMIGLELNKITEI